MDKTKVISCNVYDLDKSIYALKCEIHWYKTIGILSYDEYNVNAILYDLQTELDELYLLGMLHLEAVSLGMV